MFKEKFNEEMNNILPDDTVKAAILEKIKTEQTNLVAIAPKKSVKKRWITSIAAMLVLVIVSVTVFSLPNFGADNYIIDTDSGEEEQCSDQFVASDEPSSKQNNSDLNKNPSTTTSKNKKTTSSNGHKSATSKKSDSTVTSTESEQNTSSGTASKNETEQSGDINYPYIEKVDFPDIKYKKDAPTNITHEEAYQLAKATYYKQTEHKRHTDDGTGSALSNKAPNSNSSTSNNYTTTNVQVEGVDEGDVVKTDGKYIYVLDTDDKVIHISEVNNGKTKKISTINIKKTPYYNSECIIMDFYLCGNTIAVTAFDQNVWNGYKSIKITTIFLFDVSNPKSPEYIKEYAQSGEYISSRLIGNNLYIFSSNSICDWYIVPEKSEKIKWDIHWELPSIAEGGAELKPISEKNLYVFEGEISLEYFSAVSINLKTRKVTDTKGIIGGGNDVYVNSKSIYAVSNEITYSKEKKDCIQKAHIIKFGINKGKITPEAKGCVNGTVLNQFSMDEYDGYFRIITTIRKYGVVCGCGFIGTTGVDSNAVYVLNSKLKTIGSVKGMAKGEAVTSSRFVGTAGYFCTSPLNLKVDPFFAVDFSNPKKPEILASVKFPGTVEYLHPYGENRILGIGETESDEKIKLILFDTSDPTNIKELNSFDTDLPYSRYLFSSDCHKQFNISAEYDMVCFAANAMYNIFEFSEFKAYKDKSFVPQTDKEGYCDLFDTIDTRGIFINDYLYVCNPNGIISYDMNTYALNNKVSEIKF